MERRSFLKALGFGAAAAAAPVAAYAAISSAPEKRKPIPEAMHGQVLTAESWNRVVRDVNQLHVNRIYANEIWALNGSRPLLEFRP